MTSTNSRLALLLTIALAVSGVALFAAGSAGGQSGDAVPVDFESSGLEEADLFFWRDGTSGCDVFAGGEDGEDSTIPSPDTTSFCYAQLEEPSDTTGLSPSDSESADVQPSDESEWAEDPGVRFALDTRVGDPYPEATADGAESPFTIDSDPAALETVFSFSNAPSCEGMLTGSGSLVFHVRHYRVQESLLHGEPQQAIFTDPIAEGSEEVCDPDSSQLSIDAGLDAPVTFERDEVLVTEIVASYAESQGETSTGDNWSLDFGSEDAPSRVEVRTDQAVEQAVWATDRAGNEQTSFDPDAAEGDRFLVPHVAVRSPFGAEAVPASGYDVSIRAPGGTYVDLLTDEDGTTSTLGLDELEDLRQREGAQRVFEIEHPDDRDQPWHYPSDLTPGSYTIEVDQTLIGGFSATFERSIAMGAFDFGLEPVEGESTDHLLQPGSSTTFLLELHNRGTEPDTYDVSSAFQFSEGGDTWAVNLVGTDQGGQISVDGGETELVRAQVTPPEDASNGDRARLAVTAESLTSDTVRNTTIEAQITDQTIRDVGAFVVPDEAKEIRAGQTTTIDAFAWNQGTAQDGMSLSVVPNSTQGEDVDAFEAEVGQSTVTGISPGNVASFPIDVTTEQGVQQGDAFSFQVEVQSRSDADARATITIDTIVTAERQIEIVGLDHQNDDALDSLRFSRFNRSGASTGDCASSPADDPDRAEECDDYHNWTYHRALVTNIGDQAETVDLSVLPAGGEDSLPGRTEEIPSNDCTALLPDRLQRMQDERGIPPVQIVDRIAHEDPGSESGVSDIQLDPSESRTVYLRVGYDGRTPYHEDLNPPLESACSEERFHATVLASLDNGVSKSLSTETRFPFANTQNMPEDAQARLALTDTYTRSDGLQAELPTRTGLELGETTTMNFTLSLQQGHEDQAHLELAATNQIQDLVADGWQIRLVSLDAPADREGPREITVPSSSLASQNRSIAHASGVDYTLGLEVTPPESGAQENERFTFTVLASSDEDPGESDSLGIDTQIGRTFDFDIDPGTQRIKAHPGDEVAFALGILNEGATRDGYAIDTETTPGSVDVIAEPDNPRISSTSEQVSSLRAQIPTSAATDSDIEITASVTGERGTPEDPADDLGPLTADYEIDVRPPSTLSMEADRSLASVSPGGETSLNFSITNEKDTPQNLVISQEIGPPGWDTSLSENDAERRIDGGETITQTVLIEAPNTIAEGSTFPFLVQAQNATDDTEFAVARAEAIAQGQTALSLEVEENRTQVVDRGSTREFPLLVRNPGTSPTTYQLDASFESEDWVAQFVTAEDGNVLGNETITVPENEFRRVLVEVQAPSDVPRGHVEDVTVEAFAQGQRSVSDTANLQAEIHDFGVEIDVTGATAKDVAPGDDAGFEVSITNTGNGEDEIQLSFEGLEGEDPIYPLTSALTDDTTPTLAPGETLENVTVEVLVPSPHPDRAPVAREDGVTAVIEAQSSGDLPGGNVPSSTAQVTTRLVEYVLNDVDDDTAFEVAIDLNRDLSDGYEVFRDQDAQMIERGELNSTQSVASEGLHVLDGDDDGRIEHVIDTDNDGLGEVYLDPDRAQTFAIPFTVDVTDDAQAEHPIDADFDGVIDGAYDPAAEEVRKAAHLDLSGDGRMDLLVDTDGDTRYDRFADPHQDPPIVTDVERDGDLYKVDTDGDGQIDTHYDVETQSVQDAETANLQSFLGSYWYVLVAFLAVVVAFGVIFYRQL